jgi:tetratricopeptide (TPR) repeat protein
MRLKYVPVLALGLSLCAPRSAVAADPSARTYAERAKVHYALGEFIDAAKEYQEAYRLQQDPAFLYNAAQSLRLAGENERALVLYRNYIQFYPDEPNVAEVRAQIAKLRQAIAAAPASRNAPPAKTAAEPPPPAPAATSEPAPSVERPRPAAPSATLVATAPPPPRNKKPLYKQWWPWTIAAVVLAGGAAAAVAVVETRPSSAHTYPGFSF